MKTIRFLVSLVAAAIILSLLVFPAWADGQTNTVEGSYADKLSEAEELISRGRETEALKVLGSLSGREIAERVCDMVEAHRSKLSEKELTELAGTYGAYLTDTDTQLRYCRVLRDRGFNLRKVYPDGVSVDADLSRYQMFDADLGSDDGLDYSKVLIFSRVEPKPDLDVLTAFSSEELDEAVDQAEAARRSSEYDYQVKLHPELMVDLNSENRAWTTDDCTAIVLLDDDAISTLAMYFSITS